LQQPGRQPSSRYSVAVNIVAICIVSRIWEDYIKMYLREIRWEVEDWIRLSQNKDWSFRHFPRITRIALTVSYCFLVSLQRCWLCIGSKYCVRL
jgi:hypothetical protein